MKQQRDFLAADWPAPANIRAGTTLRTGDVSTLALPAAPSRVTQVHGANVVMASQSAGAEADAVVADSADAVCAIVTADCLPVLFCDLAGSCWAAAHAGWRGLAAGIVEATLRYLPAAPRDMLVWLGPAIGPQAFEVGIDVRDAFCDDNPADANAFVAGRREGKYYADIYALARARLKRSGVTAVYGGGLCTFSAPARFYSYRRDGQTGRMTSLIWSVEPGGPAKIGY